MIKRKFTAEDLDYTIARCWPGLGIAAREELVRTLMVSPYLSKAVDLSYFPFTEESNSSLHSFYCLCRYAMKLVQSEDVK